ncbi:adenylyltransferase/cytidyltransferase family protein [Anaplasma phagocytophilum]|uniref:nicotinate-nucleotide adenylyltransferase n=1 Tax=Anaplasma phagocytophilum str. CRT38 TaxID=1269275 RepID=S6GAJ5_ANAPH|nr:adenylyltransferase/cytidyltransferase family protein [Anaplasma phagocytophilum]EOA62270.1 putative nicotinate (nicotinamide) nucleotide adenylyltransferase [Anaplasma phagocytophilum str. CRT38]
MIVGIFGGTFDPPHEGHVYIAQKLRKLLRLREVWWVVTSRNYLKSSSKYDLEKRKDLVQEVVLKLQGMRVITMDSPRGYEVVQYCKNKYPSFKFIWIAGSDNMASIHRWYRWRDFCEMVPIVFLERAVSTYKVLKRPFASVVPRVNFSADNVCNISRGWSIIRARACGMSSTKIRNKL